MNPEWRNRYDAAVEVARQAGQIALRYFDANVVVEHKADATPVTVADREAERHIRDGLARHFPNDGYLGEEYGDQPGTSGYRWVIDPIDGTRSFVRNIPIWGTLLGLEYQGDLIAGVAVSPALGTTHHALRGHGAFRDERRIRVSDVATLSEAHLFFSSVAWFTEAGRAESFFQLSARTERQRGLGDYWGFVLIAQGSGDLMIDHGVHAWDVAALIPIVEEAGGRMTDWDGNRTMHRIDVLASNGRLHDEALKLLHLPAARP